jgi:ABC-type transport system involved in multi-copper enzyme maturation permease subunit
MISMTTRIRAIARYTVLEAVRTRLPLAVLVAILLVLGMSLFVRELALVQDARMQATVYAAIVRLVCVFIVALHVSSSLAREFNDKGSDTVLALDVPRWQYIAGKYLGYAAIGIAIAAVSALPLAVLADYAPTLAWFASLALETCIIAVVAVFCVVTFSHLPAAMAFVGGFYVLSRAIAGLRLIADHPIAGEAGLAHHAMSWALALLATLLPSLDAWTRTAWLVNAPPGWTELAFVGSETAVYLLLVFAATLVDFQRKSL